MSSSNLASLTDWPWVLKPAGKARLAVCLVQCKLPALLVKLHMRAEDASFAVAVLHRVLAATLAHACHMTYG